MLPKLFSNLSSTEDNLTRRGHNSRTPQPPTEREVSSDIFLELPWLADYRPELTNISSRKRTRGTQAPDSEDSDADDGKLDELEEMLLLERSDRRAELSEKVDVAVTEFRWHHRGGSSLKAAKGAGV